MQKGKKIKSSLSTNHFRVNTIIININLKLYKKESMQENKITLLGF